MTLARTLRDDHIEERIVIDRTTGEVSERRHLLLKPDPAHKGDTHYFTSLPAGTVMDEARHRDAGWSDREPDLPGGCTLDGMARTSRLCTSDGGR
ncbi:hypothetical protein GCM10010466_28950 [Planomonospora alba]|uniref:Uncharacterized protein n=1 Tax=Planomonospora alba TaxID=161354 RepID=A0ABP6N4M8_9ACTN